MPIVWAHFRSLLSKLTATRELCLCYRFLHQWHSLRRVAGYLSGVVANSNRCWSTAYPASFVEQRNMTADKGPAGSEGELQCERGTIARSWTVAFRAAGWHCQWVNGWWGWWDCARCQSRWLTAWVVVVRPTRHKTGHFGGQKFASSRRHDQFKVNYFSELVAGTLAAWLLRNSIVNSRRK